MVKRFFLSPKTVISLICTVGLSCLIGSIVPQVTTKTPQFFETWKARSPEVYYVIDLLQLNQVYTSVWFLVLVAMIALCLIFSLYYQSKALIKFRRFIQKDITKTSFKDHIVIESAQTSE
jgi:cytochrome c biogenesis protein ResB